MQEELIVIRRENHVLTVRITDGQIVQIQADAAEQDSLLGNIYVGKVRNIVKNIHAAFVEIQKGQMGYLSLDTSCIPIHTDGVPFQPGRVLIGDEIIVQVSGEAVKTKPPTLSGKIELTGKYVVLSSVGECLQVQGDSSGQDQNQEKKRSSESRQPVRVSKKIQDKKKREDLKQLLDDYCTPEYGFVVRTNSVLASEEVLRQETESLIRQYERITNFGKHKAQFTLLKQSTGGYLSQIRDSYQNHLTQIMTDDDALYQEIQEYLAENGWENSELLKRWSPENGTLDAVYQISKTLDHALMPKVWLKCGGYLIIQPTEALISIDVNTGKAVTKKRDVQQTFRKVNREAALEIARQLRLRNLSGMILIDFIDMKSKQDQKDIMDVLKQAVSQDPVQTTVVDMTKLGLVEVTRKKIRKSLYEQIK
ncbi:MAG: ribonuclease E/G [Lachnospiraceae bacterium]|nr:ribonuclease E/G [Lachnospiraceae bacterium]